MSLERPTDGESYLNRWLTLQKGPKPSTTRRLAHVFDLLAQAAQQRKDWAAAEFRLAKAQATLGSLDGAASKDVAAILNERIVVALRAGRFDDAQSLITKGLDIQETLLGRDDADIAQARILLAGGYLDHVGDRHCRALGRRLDDFAGQVSRDRKKRGLGALIGDHAELLRLTSRVLPPPTKTNLDEFGRLADPFTLSPDALKYSPILYISSIESMLDDAALAHVRRFYDLEQLELKGRAAGGDQIITDAGVGHLKDLIDLRKLSLRGTEITDAGLAHLAALENLEELNLGITRVSDAGLIHLKGLKSLRQLWLSATNVTDAGLADLEAIPSLRHLYLNATRVTEAGVERLRRARPDLEVEHRSGPGYRPLKGVPWPEPAASR